MFFKFLLVLWIISIPFKNAIFQGSIGLIILFFIYSLFKNKDYFILIENLKKVKYLSIGFFLIVSSMILSNLVNPENLSQKSWHTTFMFVIRYGLIFVCLAYFYKKNYFEEKFVKILVYSSLVYLALLGLYELILNPSILNGIGIHGTLSNRNSFGLHMGMGVVLSAILFMYNKKIAVLLFIVFTFLMMFSFSRSSWVASFSSILVLMIFNYREIKMSHILYMFGFIGFLLAVYFSSDSLQVRFSQLLEGYSSQRTTIWSYTIEFIKLNLTIGYGIDSWASLPNAYLNKFPDPHNMVLEILLYTGLIGFFFCFLTIFIILKKIVKSKNYIYLSISIYFLVITQFDFGAFFTKEILSFLTIFVFLVYSKKFKEQ